MLHILFYILYNAGNSLQNNRSTRVVPTHVLSKKNSNSVPGTSNIDTYNATKLLKSYSDNHPNEVRQLNIKYDDNPQAVRNALAYKHLKSKSVTIDPHREALKDFLRE